MSPADIRSTSLLKSVAPILPARSMSVSVNFYQRLGFLVEPYEDGAVYCFLLRDEQALHLRLAGPKELADNPGGVYFYVDDADVLYEEVVAAGISALHEPEDKPWRMREFALSDPDGTLLRFGHRLHLL